MPYSNLPKRLWPRMEKCVADVKAKGKVDNAYAICYTSIMKRGVVEDKVSAVIKKKK